MIERVVVTEIRKRLQDYPAVAILGPRQVGKTTLAKTMTNNYFDLEDEQDKIRLDVEWENIVKSDSLVVLDEAQAFPLLFSRLRSTIDKDRKRNGRFLILGSVSPVLMHQVSESLAGRIFLCEMTPFNIKEIIPSKWDNLWRFGGFPDGGILKPQVFPGWQKSYLTLLSQRDLPLWGMPSKPQMTARLFQMIASMNGQVWNASHISQSLGVSYHTVNTYTDFLENAYLIRKLQPFSSNIRKRLVKSPKIFWRDSGLLHYLLNVGQTDDLLDFPWIGFSWEGWIIEQVLSLLQPVSFKAYYLRTQSRQEIDLVLELGKKLWAIEIKLSSAPAQTDFKTIQEVGGLIKADKMILLSRKSGFLENSRMVATDLTGLMKLIDRDILA